jgi:glycosyltransferase involved in cell wall biosynthesis
LFPQKKVFTTFHGYESYPIKKKAIVIRKVSELLSNGNICVGEFMRKWYKANPDYIIYGGVNIPKKFKKVSEPKAIFFGRLDKQTSIETYLKAAEIIKEKIPTFELIVFGDGPLIGRVKTAVYGFDVEIEKKIANYRFVFVSRYLSILEALVAKKMVFAVYDNPLKRDYLAMSPFKDFVSISGSPKELASRVQHYYSNKNIEQDKIEAGHAWAKKQTWQHIAEIYLKLWKSNSK